MKLFVVLVMVSSFGTVAHAASETLIEELKKKLPASHKAFVSFHRNEGRNLPLENLRYIGGKDLQNDFRTAIVWANLIAERKVTRGTVNVKMLVGNKVPRIGVKFEPHVRRWRYDTSLTNFRRKPTLVVVLPKKNILNDKIRVSLIYGLSLYTFDQTLDPKARRDFRLAIDPFRFVLINKRPTHPAKEIIHRAKEELAAGHKAASQILAYRIGQVYGAAFSMVASTHILDISDLMIEMGKASGLKKSMTLVGKQLKATASVKKRAAIVRKLQRVSVHIATDLFNELGKKLSIPEEMTDLSDAETGSVELVLLERLFREYRSQVLKSYDFKALSKQLDDELAIELDI